MDHKRRSRTAGSFSGNVRTLRLSVVGPGAGAVGGGDGDGAGILISLPWASEPVGSMALPSDSRAAEALASAVGDPQDYFLVYPARRMGRSAMVCHVASAPSTDGLPPWPAAMSCPTSVLR